MACPSPKSLPPSLINTMTNQQHVPASLSATKQAKRMVNKANTKKKKPKVIKSNNP